MLQGTHRVLRQHTQGTTTPQHPAQPCDCDPTTVRPLLSRSDIQLLPASAITTVTSLDLQRIE
eukprot:1667636-Pyramimonas_sp.AAC.1